MKSTSNTFFCLSDRILTENDTLFTYGDSFNKKRRQADDGPQFECTSFDDCGDHSFVGVSFEDLTFTEEQIDLCNNDESCLFDLAVTGDEEFANTTLESSEEDKKIQEAISKAILITIGMRYESQGCLTLHVCVL